ncbi:uncharacterized protein [Diabrotica undecimpunctata]|uniref:uncharacterized protein n=1 Tax=Diabrotica undecimpunctata TaxID=50387 RepID=UPI003B638E30
MHLAKAEEKMIVEKLISGVPSSRILEDSRKLETPKLERLALLTSKDLSNWSRKYNTYKKRDQNDMVATALKVQEWNANNKNYAFLFKKEDDAARCLAETSIIKSRHQEEINEFVRGKVEQTNVIQENTRRYLQNENFKNVIDSLHDLDDETYTQLHDTFMRDVQEARRKVKKEFQETPKDITKKQKMEKQEYFPSNKKRN